MSEPRRARRVFRVGGAPLLAAIALVGCDRAPGPGRAGSGSGDAAAPAVELPPLDDVDASMRERLLDAQDELERLRGAGAEGSRLAEAYGALGMQLHALALLDVARDAYAAAARLDGADPRWPCYLGAVEERRNDPAAAERRNAACVELRPDYVAGWVRLGQVRSERGDAAGARDAFRRALALDARCAAAMAGLGTLAAREKRHEEARDLFEQALAIAPEADNLHFHLAMAYRALGDAERAARHMERRGEVKVGVRDPLLDRIDALVSGVRGYTELGERLGRAGRYDEAAAALEQAVAADPDDALAHLYLGFVRTRQGRLDDALASFARVRELEPDNERAWFFAGRVHVARGEDAEALAAFREAVRLHPRQARARLELGLQLQRAGEHAAAADELDRAVALDPANAQARLARAFALVRLGRWAGAREALEDDVRTLPDEPAFLHALARILAAAPDAEVRDGTRGLALAEQLSRSMQNLDLAETVGMALAEAGRVDEAARWQRDLIDLARGSGAVGRLPRLRRQLASYEHGGGWREPWDRDDPVFTPTRPGAPITVDEMAAREEGTQPE